MQLLDPGNFVYLGLGAGILGEGGLYKQHWGWGYWVKQPYDHVSFAT